ncbi:MAG TPA: Gfo/Idh/MocA family oxidoreductase [Candidatus Bathyarchaeia archaeon]|nr:Gfo/Idh/MocA family oxidoreductase [Candidatus Bathyarchaeia archaeon]
MKVESVNEFRLNPAIRIGLVGCGRVAEFGYLPALRRVPTMKLAGVVDVNKTRCDEIAPGVPAHDNLCALIEAGGLDALIICTPTRFHLAQARCAAKAQLPALLEKPPGLNVGEASALQSLDPSPWIAFNRRFEPGIISLKKKLPRDGHMDLRLELHYRKKSWKSFDMQDDVLLDLGPHLIDLTRWLTAGEILSARAVSLTERRVKFELKLERGHATILCSNNAPYRERIEVKDARGRVCGSYRRGGLVSGITARFQPNRENPLVRPILGQLEAFGRAVCGMPAETALATAADGLAVMPVIDAVRRSALQGGVECSLQLQH